MRRWGGTAERAEKLSASFAALTEYEDFMTLIHDFDEKTAAIFAGERIWTLSDWLRIGKKLTNAVRDGSSVPTKYASELADVKRDISTATAVRNILRSFVSASDNDYRLRCAPERFRTRVFRDLAQDFSNIVESAATVKHERIPDFLHGIGEALKAIIEVAEKKQGICRWNPLTTEGRRRRRRWLQGCKEGHEVPRQRVLGEARRVERHAERGLTLTKRKRRRAVQCKRLAEQSKERAAQRKEEQRLAKAAKRIEDRVRREADAAALEESVRATAAVFASEREANRAAYIAAKAAMGERGTGNGERAGVLDTSLTGFTELREEPPAPPVSPVPPVLQVPEASSLPSSLSPLTLSDAIAADLPTHPFRGMSLDETAPTDEEIAGDAALPGWSDDASDDSFSSPIPHTSSLSSGGMPPKEPPEVTIGGCDDDDDDERRREREERIRRIREQYGFTLGKKPVTPEAIEGKKRYVADRTRETAIRNREIDLVLHGKERKIRAAVKKRKATIARKKREEAAQAARAAKEAEREAKRKEREEARQTASKAQEEALEVQRRERAECKALAREFGVPLQKARWTAKHKAIWSKGLRRKAKEKLKAEREARQAAESHVKAERAKAL